MQLVQIASGHEIIHGELYATGDPTAPLIVLLTGDGQKGLASSTWPVLIRELRARGMDVFGFDFQGLGRSSGQRSDLTIGVGVENLTSALNYLDSGFGASNRRIAFIASSFGGAVLLASPEAFSRASAIAFKSPVSDPVETYQIEAGGVDQIAPWEADGFNRKIGLKYAAYKEAKKLDLYKNAAKISAPTLIVHGTADTIVPFLQSRKLIESIRSPATMIAIEGGEHDYKTPGALERFVSETTSFLDQQLR